jgi:hypothetical protein
MSQPICVPQLKYLEVLYYRFILHATGTWQLLLLVGDSVSSELTIYRGIPTADYYYHYSIYNNNNDNYDNRCAT